MRDFGCRKLFITSLSRTAPIYGHRTVATRRYSCRPLPADSTLSLGVPRSLRNHMTATAPTGRLASESALYAHHPADSTWKSPVWPPPSLSRPPLVPRAGPCRLHKGYGCAERLRYSTGCVLASALRYVYDLLPGRRGQPLPVSDKFPQHRNCAAIASPLAPVLYAPLMLQDDLGNSVRGYNRVVLQ
jgi:hypothetical protein